MNALQHMGNPNGFMQPNAEFDCLNIYGGPLIVPSAFDYKYYDSVDLLDIIENGFYDDFDPYDIHEVFTNQKQLGQRECLDLLLDHAGGDFDVVGKQHNNHGIIDIDGDFFIGNIGDGS